MLKTISKYISEVFHGQEILAGGKAARWTKVKYLKPGAKIAVVGTEDMEKGDKGDSSQKGGNNGIGTGTIAPLLHCSIANDVFFDEITSIKAVGREQVYDIEVENSRNFVGNGILAHNTYISGNIGVGATSPDYKLQVEDTQNSTASALIANLSDTGTNNPIGLMIKLGADADNPDTADRFINFMKGDATIIGKIQGNASGGITYETTGTDFAEYFGKKEGEDFSEGDVVALTDDQQTVTKSKSDYDNRAVGVVSTNAGFAGGTGGENKILVGLIGQVPVKIASQSAEIKIGDPVTTAAEEGKAQKQIQTGPSIGKALENWDPNIPKEKIMVLLNLTYFVAENSQTYPNSAPVLVDSQISSASANLKVEKLEVSQSLTVLGETSVKNLGITGVLTNGLLYMNGLSDVDGLAGADIKTLSGPLRLQPDSLGNVEIMGTNLVIDTKGNVTVKSALSTKKLNITVGDVLSAAVGTVEIPAGIDQIQVKTTALTENSKIFVAGQKTPVAVSSEITGNDTFTIKISNYTSEDITSENIKINWWIVN